MAYILCIDYDQTLVSGHYHNALMSQGITPGHTTENNVEYLIKKYPLNNPEDMCLIIRRTLNSGNHVAILSFTSFPEIINPTLKKMGLNDDEIRKIFVLGHFPPNDPKIESGKNKHIESAMKHFKVEGNENIILVDDSTDNIKKAKEKDHKVVQVPSNPRINCGYIDELNDEISKLNPPIKKRDLACAISTAEDWSALLTDTQVCSNKEQANPLSEESNRAALLLSEGSSLTRSNKRCRFNEESASNCVKRKIGTSC